ncbi:SKI family transcriptional corepressor 1a [Aplochiton taeniatus]
MESIPTRQPAGRDSSSPPKSKQDVQSFSNPGTLKPNQVSQTALYGVHIVSLVIDGQERLCLAQISNTLLKHYSYNEIHNRRVALGITCVQCTPVQLEILRRAGAMPISSRRCGMITKREAERLCKSFLGAHNPPKLPENFAFDVSHECAWGSRGNFIPARYNSSRAKCIKCTYCNMYFSPNKFIFHSHRTPESKYTQPDAANFNSWRRHLKLSDKNSPDDIAHAWEDVKAMFNGGSRKRTLPMSVSEMSPMKSQASSNLSQRSSPDQPHKTMRCSEERISNLSVANGVRNYPVIPVPSKSFGILQKIPPPLFPHPYGFPAFGLCQKKDDGGVEVNKNVSGVFWPSAKDSMYPSFPMFWPTAGGMSMSPYQQSPKPPSDLLTVRQNELESSDQSDRCANTSKDSFHDSGRCSSSQSTRNDEDKSGDEARPIEGSYPTPRKINYISAFRPVVKDAETIAKLYGNRDTYNGVRSGYLSPDFVSESSSYRSISPDVDSVEDPDVDVESNRGQEDPLSLQLSSLEERTNSPPLNPALLGSEESQESQLTVGPRPSSPDDPHSASSDDERHTHLPDNDTPNYEVYIHEKDRPMHLNRPSTFGSKPLSGLQESNRVLEVSGEHKKGVGPIKENELQKCHEGQDNQCDVTLQNGANIIQEKDIGNMAKEELQKQLVEQMELRKKLEREFQSLKDNFQDQMKRELSYREEMVQQLQIVRDTLCSKLDQERKARYAIQQKLKEAHDALHHFSCKMLTPRHCTGTCTFKPPILPP